MKRTCRLLALLALACSPATAQDEDYFLNPPGCQWGQLLLTNAEAYCVSAAPSGYVVAGRCEHPSYGPDTAVSLLLSPEGHPGYAAFFPGVEAPEGWRLDSAAFSIVPSYLTGGETDGYLVTGYRELHFEEDERHWHNPALWAAKLDVGLNPIWQQTLEAPHGVGRWGNAVIWDPAGFYERAGALIGGAQTFDLGQTPAQFHGGGGWTQGLATRLYSDGEVHWEVVASDPAREWMGIIYSVAPLQGGGYVFGTSDGICVTSSGLTLQWVAQETNSFYSVKPTSDGGCIGVGAQAEGPGVLIGGSLHTYTDVVLTKVDATGAVEWTRTFGLPEEDDVGHCVTIAPGGDFVLVGEAGKPMHIDASDALVARVSSSGDVRWDVRLGGSHDVAAYSVVEMPGNSFLVAGTALGKMWLFKLRGNLSAPVPRFTCSPASPVFVSQEITFDASASSAPGGSITDYAWDFGDGQTATGQVVRHTYHTPTNYTVSLAVTSSDGVVRSAAQTVEIIHLAVQWERTFDKGQLHALTESWDGGFVLTGADSQRGDAHTSDLWLMKTDSRGRAVWDRNYRDSTCTGYSEGGYGVARAPTTGYVVAGKRCCRATRDDGWLLKVNEAGDVEWAKAYLGSGDNSDVLLCAAPLADGGYILSGSTWQHTYGDPIWPWLVRTDADGNELENWKLPLTSSRYRGEWVAPIPDASGYVVACGSGQLTGTSSILVAKVRTDRTVEWINSLPDSPSHTSYGGRWATATSDGGFVAVGTAYMDFGTLQLGERSCVVKLSATGDRLGTNFWPSASVRARSYGLGGAVIPDGGFVMVGAYEDTATSIADTDLAMRVTDAEGQTRWAWTTGTTNTQEYGRAVLALPASRFVVLAERAAYSLGSGGPWLFNLAPNHPPVARMHLSTNCAPVGEVLTFDGSGSTDRDGAVVLHEWDFGDGQTATGPIVSHAYTNSGLYVVRLAAVDELEAEGIALQTNCVVGVSGRGSGFEIADYSITNCPGCDPAIFPFEGAPPLLDWTTALGATVQIRVTAPDTKVILITFPDPIPAEATLYQLDWVPWSPSPLWRPISYSVIDTHTIRLPGGATDSEYVLVLASLAPLPSMAARPTTIASRLALTIATTAGFRYRVERTPELTSPAWVNLPHARTADGPLEFESLTGSGATETVFVEASAESSFFRVTMEAIGP